MSKRRFKAQGDKREPGGFLALPHAVLRSAEFARLSNFGLKALMDLLAQYRGDNNGDFCAAWTVMAKRGWRSRDSLAKGLRELREADLIVVTRQGGKHRATLYGVTFFEIDWCSGKLDIRSPTRIFMGSWRKVPLTVAPMLPSAAPSVPRTPVHSVADCTAERVSTGMAA